MRIETTHEGWINLYTFLIDYVSCHYCMGDIAYEDIDDGLILVNGNKPEDINMRLNMGDIITVKDKDYKVDKLI